MGPLRKAPKHEYDQKAERSLISWLVKEEVALTLLGPYSVELMLAPMVCTPVAAEMRIAAKPLAFRMAIAEAANDAIVASPVTVATGTRFSVTP